ncbi:Ropporin-1-like protein [Quaeritorhiza haematococci]|nr:Ropporin-1-like protein [Quaeritorhiza haematococci]
MAPVISANVNTKKTWGPPEALYCSEQIHIPPELPEILKNYTKHIIRTQPTDILSSSAEYFTRLARQKTSENGNRLTAHQLEAFFSKFGAQEETAVVSKKEIEAACDNAKIPTSVGEWTDRVPWLKFWALLVASAAGSLHATIDLACQIVGDNGQASVSLVIEMLQFLVARDPEMDEGVAREVLRTIAAYGQEIPIVKLQEILRNDLPFTHIVSTPPGNPSEWAPAARGNTAGGGKPESAITTNRSSDDFDRSQRMSAEFKPQSATQANSHRGSLSKFEDASADSRAAPNTNQVMDIDEAPRTESELPTSGSVQSATANGSTDQPSETRKSTTSEIEAPMETT